MAPPTMTNNVLTTKNDTRIHQFDDSPTNLLNKSIVLYGGSNSGKTTIIKHFLHKLMPYAPTVFVVCPTEPNHNTYKQFLPKEMIHYNLDPDSNGETFLTKFIQWQESRTVTYKAVNDIKNLLLLYNKLPDQRINSRIEEIKAIRKKGNKTDKCDLLLCHIIKEHIYKNLDKYTQVASTDADKMILKYTYINPHAIIIFDDCAATFKSMFKSKEFRDLFYQGRHKNITTMLSCQDNTDIEAYIRKNAAISVYTQYAVVESNFKLASNGCGKDVFSKAKDVATTIFNNSTAYTKMIYMINDPTDQHFYHIKASIQPVRVHPVIRKICKKSSASQVEIPKTNRYANTFKV